MTTPYTPPSLFSNRVFTRLWATVELSFLGTFVHVVACSWLMTSMTDSATLVALTQTANALPLVIFSIFAGALADTTDQRTTMIWALSISTLGSILLAGAAFFGLLGPWSMLTLLFCVGVGVAIFTPSWQASLGSLVERDQLAEAVSLHNMGANLMRTIGPTLGGFLVTVVGAPITFMVGAFSYLPAIITLSFWHPETKPSNTERESLMAAMAGGLRFVAASQHLQPIFARVFCFSTGAISIMALLPLIARDQLNGDATAYGFLFGGFGLGAILGGFLLRIWRKRQSNEWIVRRAILINVFAILALAVSETFMMGMIATILAGACWLTVHSLQNTTLQLATPRWIVGRMVAMFLTSAFLGLSVGSWLWGAVAQQSGTQIALAASAFIMAGTFLLALRYPLPETHNLIIDPLPESPHLEMPTSGRGTSGLVQLIVEHHIDPDYRSAFHRLMFQRRQHLMRLGARHWTLLNELGERDIWLESFQLTNWSDFERFLSRRTAETVSLRDKVRAVQKDQSDPKVRRFVVANPGSQQQTMMLRT